VTSIRLIVDGGQASDAREYQMDGSAAEVADKLQLVVDILRSAAGGD
jgi:hypothetical protein